MSITYTTIPTQFSTLLRIARKALAAWEHWRKNSDANFNNRLIQDNFSGSIDEEGKAQRIGEALLTEQADTLGGLFEEDRDLFDDTITAILDADLATAKVEEDMIDYLYSTPVNDQYDPVEGDALGGEVGRARWSDPAGGQHGAGRQERLPGPDSAPHAGSCRRQRGRPLQPDRIGH